MRRRISVTVVLVAIPAVMTLGLVSPASAASSDNGVANMSANQIAAATSSALNSAGSFTYGGSVSSGGTANALKISLNSSGNGQGTIGSSGEPVRVIKAGNNLYMNSNAAFWTKASGAANAKALANRWVAIPGGDSDFAGISGAFVAQQVTGEFLSSSTSFTKGKTSTVNGQKVIAIRGKDTGVNTINTIYVATTGKPYVVKITSPGANGESLIFAGYNKPVNPTAPANPIVIPSSSTSTTG